jgi:hypothetical protein
VNESNPAADHEGIGSVGVNFRRRAAARLTYPKVTLAVTRRVTDIPALSEITVYGEVPPVGTCFICGAWGQLSFEHVPPQAAYNNERVFEANIRRMVAERSHGQQQPLTGKWVQGGAGKYTLCNKCNNDTGGWYGGAYVSWARQGVELLERSGGKLSLAHPYKVFPLGILKQVVAMFCSACGPNLRLKFPDLVPFVLQREARYMPHDLHVFGCLMHPDETGGFRQSGMNQAAGNNGLILSQSGSG